VRLTDKLRLLREIEGTCRGLSRALSKAEVVRLIQTEHGDRISIPYLSQLEAGARRHLTNKTRLLLARFFRVHPGYLVDDPEDFREHIGAPLGDGGDALTRWLRSGAARFRDDPLLSQTLERLAANPDRRSALHLLREVLGRPPLMERLLHALQSGKD